MTGRRTVGELSGQAREAIATRMLDNRYRFTACDDAAAIADADLLLAALLGDGRSVGAALDDGAAAGRIGRYVALGRLARNMTGGLRWILTDDRGTPFDLRDVDPEAAALLARLGSGGGVPDGEGDVG